MIRLPKFLMLSLLVTCFCLLYVWQQTEVFRLAYDGQKNLACFEELLDENSNLRYNLKKNTSLVKIGSKVCATNDFQMPDNYCLVRLADNKDNSNTAGGLAKQKTLFSRIFEIKRQAEAKTLSSSNSF